MLNPFPSNPSRPTRFAITAIKAFPGEPSSRVHCVGFYDCYGAATWVRVMIGNEECVRRGNELITASGIKLRSYELEAILGYELTGKERDYRLPDEYILNIARFRRGTWEQPSEPVELEVRTLTHIGKKQKPVTLPRDEKPAGFITVTELCRNTPVSPMNARALLRASNYVKPAYGWAFAPAQVPEIRKLCGL
jgi:hypothetical protein